MQPPVCVCNGTHTGVDCSECFPGYYAGTGDVCHPCPGIGNTANAGALSGGNLVVACYYKGLCGPSSGGNSTQCTSCRAGWTGPSCCEWTAGPSSPWAMVGGVCVLIAFGLTFVMRCGGINARLVLLFIAPSLQVRFMICPLVVESLLGCGHTAIDMFGRRAVPHVAVAVVCWLDPPPRTSLLPPPADVRAADVGEGSISRGAVRASPHGTARAVRLPVVLLQRRARAEPQVHHGGAGPCGKHALLLFVVVSCRVLPLGLCVSFRVLL